MRYLRLGEVLFLQNHILSETGGRPGLRSLTALDSALAIPRQTFGGVELHPTLAGKAAALGFHLIQNHAFLDGNKRIGHAAMESFLLLNGWEIEAGIDEQERIILGVASGKIDLPKFATWVERYIRKSGSGA